MNKKSIKAYALTIMFVSLVVASAVASTAHAQTPHRITADIPFDFEVDGKRLAAGNYAATRLYQNGLLQLLATRGEGHAMRQTIPMLSREREPQAKLVFRRYGNRYFLSQVWFGDSLGGKLRECKAERDCRELLLRAQMQNQNSTARTDIAEPEIVTVTANIE